ncbi:MAG: AtpZ/AtpI family protein [Oscillospiraceae bacterium]|jgi:F0F1-type ATP synthase assembly protein I|nr:AtpZ/AtpI family protein [Oscillospiraceae bacterium]
MNKDSRGEIFRAFALLTQLGFSMAACVFVGFIAGKYLDRFFGTSPWLLIVGSLIGGLSSLKVLYDIATKERDKK